jgi:methylmalonyl-CoA mutase N-terminal domain/subunit
MGGTQSLHTNSYDEALSLPTEKAAEIALRTQQIIGYESGCADSADPLAGSYYVEYLTNQLENRITDIMIHIDKQGGAVSCIENGYYSGEIGRAAYEIQKAVEGGERVVVGVNRFKGEESSSPQMLKVDPLLEENQKERLKKMKAGRDNKKVNNCLNNLRRTAESSENIVGPVIEAVENYATVGEISEQFRKVWGEYHAKN